MIRIIKKGTAAPPPVPVAAPLVIPKKAPIMPPAPKPAPPIGVEPVLDGECRAAIKLAPMAIVPWFCMASYLYYIHNKSLLSDALYDQIAKEMLDNWEDVEHPHKHLFTQEDLETGSLYRLRGGDYPLSVRGAACRLAQISWGVKLNDVKDDAFDAIE
jgi:hypothetical protein